MARSRHAARRSRDPPGALYAQNDALSATNRPLTDEL